MKNKLIIPASTGFTISLTLFLTIIIKSQTPLELNLFLAYVGIGIIGFGYSILLQKFKMVLGSNLFFVFSIISGAYFYISMPRGSDGLSQLAAFLGWILLIVISILLPLIIEFIIRLRKKRIK